MGLSRPMPSRERAMRMRRKALTIAEDLVLNYEAEVLLQQEILVQSLERLAN